ncbi:MAG: Ti-type conjugative transfer relaxase TraA [Proteobacteria bacterium]|nr:Ti-type conjugative transfer relaxase TraA [Pseudomonadota bacterium]
MAVCHFALQAISRGKGRSSIAAAAYRSGTALTNEATGKRHDYSRRVRSGEIDPAETGILLPQGVAATWALDRGQLWNAAERAERRKDSRVATEILLALPAELDRVQRRALTTQYAQMLADRYDVAVDYAIHPPSKAGDQRNHHAHLLMTTRRISAQGMGERSALEHNEDKRKALGLLRRAAEIRNLREEWAQLANRALERAGQEARLDPRSYRDRGIDIGPQPKKGPAGNGLQRRFIVPDMLSISPQTQAVNAELIRAHPEQLLRLLGDSQSVFTRQEIAQTLDRYVADHAQFQICLAAVMACPELLALPSRRERQTLTLPEGRTVDLPAKYTLKSTADLEWKLLADALALASTRTLGPQTNRGLTAQTLAIAVATLAERDGIELSPSQRSALDHVTGPESLSAIVGVAGAGKSTLLKAARLGWEREGFRVFGAATAGKAAQGLGQSSGIRSTTIASLILSWDKGAARLISRDVLVIDEAGMIDSKTMARLVHEVRLAGAKIVLVGDPEQLPAIGAGAPFRALIERVEPVRLLEVRRQSLEWQRAATVAFAQSRTADALQAYSAESRIRLEADPVARAIELFLESYTRPGTQAALAHTNSDVTALNDGIRSGLKRIGVLVGGQGGVYQTRAGAREFLSGDRITLLRNARLRSADGRGLLEVRNGQLGNVVRADHGALTVKIDDGGMVQVSLGEYPDVDHGYALTVHKTQGATLDRVYALESAGMDRNLLYVAMSRHRQDCLLIADKASHKDVDGLIRSLARRHNVKEMTLDYEGPGLAPAERAWVAAEAERRRSPELEQLRILHATADYEARRETFGRSSTEIAALAARYRPPPLAGVLAADATLLDLDRQLAEARGGSTPPEILTRLGTARERRERQVTAEYDQRWRADTLRVAALVRHEAAAIVHERQASAAMPTLLRYEGRPSPTFNRAEWALASDTLIRTRDRHRAYRTLCDVLARRRPAPADFARDMRTEIAGLQQQSLAVVDTSPPPRPHRERQLLVPPPFVRSTLIGRHSPPRTPQEYDAAAERFSTSDQFRAMPAGAPYYRDIGARAKGLLQDRRPRARERQAAALPDTPQHRAFASRGYASFGTTGQVSIGTRMVATVEALQIAAPHLSATSEAGRAAKAVFALIGRYNEGRATNGELDQAIKDMIFATPPATHQRRTGHPVRGREREADPWAKATAAARELLTTVHDLDLQLDLDRRVRGTSRTGRSLDR